MNVFALHENPIVAAQMHCDKHVVKMIVEHCQILCTVLVMLGVDRQRVPYRPCFQHHPSVKWAAESLENYMWLLHCTLALCDEKLHRYGTPHKSRAVVLTCAALVPEVSFPRSGRTEFARAIKKDIYPHLLDTSIFTSSVEAYREYYRIDKRRFAKWSNREKPYWWPYP